MADDELEELRERTDRGSRLETATDDTDRAAFQESIAEHLASIDDGERQKALSAWDGPLAAFVAALEDHPERYEKVAAALGDELGVGVDAPKKSELLALTLRVGFQEVASEDLEALRDALREDAAKGL